jgi:regulatory protein YycH of two-component signal transduction system YycFG
MTIMDKERLKTFLLLSLVCISVFLTRKLWIEVPYEISPFFQKEEEVSANYLFTDMIKPHRYLLNFDEKNHTIFYNDDNNDLWTSTRSSLVDILSSNNIKTNTLSDEEFLTYNEKKSIVFYFPEKYNTYILARSLDVTKPNGITEKMPKIDSIYFYLGREEPFVVFSEGSSI